MCIGFIVHVLETFPVIYQLGTFLQSMIIM